MRTCPGVGTSIVCNAYIKELVLQQKENNEVVLLADSLLP